MSFFFERIMPIVIELGEYHAFGGDNLISELTLQIRVSDFEKGLHCRLMNELQIDHFEICSREEVPAKWATFADPWGNRLGFFENNNE